MGLPVSATSAATKTVEARLDRVGDFVQPCRAFANTELAPLSAHSLAGSLHCGIDYLPGPASATCATTVPSAGFTSANSRRPRTNFPSMKLWMDFIPRDPAHRNSLAR